MNAYLPPHYGGAELAALKYAERVRASGGDSVLIGMADGSGEQDAALPEWVRPALVPESRPADGMRGVLPSSVRAGLRLGRPLWRLMWQLKDRYDVVHVFNSSPLFNLLAAPFGRLLGKPVVLEMSLMGSDDPLTLRARDRSGDDGLVPSVSRSSLLFRSADGYVAKSPALADAYLEAGLPEGKLWNIPYGVDIDRYRPASGQEQRQFREKLGVPSEVPVALFVGGISERKGVHWLLEALSMLREASVDLHLLLVGPTEKYDPAYVDRIRRMISDESLAGSVTMVDRVVENVHEYMYAADIYVLPSTREGLPITVLEAMASGLAVVASDIPEIARTQISSGENGLLFPVGDEEALSRALRAVAQDSDLRAELGSAARERAEDRFSTRAVDRRYRDMYESIGAGRG